MTRRMLGWAVLGVVVAVNLSASDLLDEHLTERILALLTEYARYRDTMSLGVARRALARLLGRIRMRRSFMALLNPGATHCLPK